MSSAFNKAVALCLSALWIVSAFGCDPTECDRTCDRLVDLCAGKNDTVCHADCEHAEEACERCFLCLEAQGECEREQGGPCEAECVGCGP